jgi:hypothetical protein
MDAGTFSSTGCALERLSLRHPGEGQEKTARHQGNHMTRGDAPLFITNREAYPRGALFVNGSRAM